MTRVPAFPVLFVCVGNVCRSPFGERLMRLRLDGVGATEGDVIVTSAGIMAAAGRAMHPAMAEHLEALGGSADGFVARQVQPPMIADAGLVLAATRDLRTRVLQEVPGALRRTFTVLELAELSRRTPAAATLPELVRRCADERSSLPAGDYDVPDPIRGGPEDFADCAATLDAAVTTIVRMFAGD